MAKKRPQPMHFDAPQSAFDSLISTPSPDLDSQGGTEIPLKSIWMPEQSRKYFDPEQIAMHQQSMRENGRFPGHAGVRPLSDDEKLEIGDQYEWALVYGETRCRSAMELNWAMIPVEILDVSPAQAQLIHLQENLNRKNLSAFEEVEALLRVMQEELGTEGDEVMNTLNFANRWEHSKGSLDNFPSPQNDNLSKIVATLERFGRGSWQAFRGKVITVKKTTEVLKKISPVGVEEIFSHFEWTKLGELNSLPESMQSEFLQWMLDEQPSRSQIKKRKKELTATQAKETTQPKYVTVFLERVQSIQKQVQGGKALTDSERRSKADALLKQLEELLSES